MLLTKQNNNKTLRNSGTLSIHHQSTTEVILAIYFTSKGKRLHRPKGEPFLFLPPKPHIPRVPSATGPYPGRRAGSCPRRTVPSLPLRRQPPAEPPGCCHTPTPAWASGSTRRTWRRRGCSAPRYRQRCTAPTAGLATADADTAAPTHNS